MTRTPFLFAALGLIAACGGSDSSPAATDPAPADTAVAVTEPTAATTPTSTTVATTDTTAPETGSAAAGSIQAGLADLDAIALPDGDAFWPAAVAAFPDSGKLWFGHGNSLWKQGQQHKALDAFRTATEKAPDFAAAWNNRAYAEQALGNKKSANDSICRAHALAPGDQTIRDSVAELAGQSCSSSADAPSAEGCCAAN